MAILLFEDDFAARLHPITLGRPAFAIRCGSYRLVDLVTHLERSVRAVVRPHLREVLEADTPDLAAPPKANREPILMLNARAVPRAGLLAKLQRILKAGKPCRVMWGEALAAALIPPGKDPPAAFDAQTLAAWRRETGLETDDVELPLLDYPHDVVRLHGKALSDNLEYRLAVNDYREVADGVFASHGVKLGQFLATDTSQGPIVLEEEVAIGPHCYLRGPVHIERGAKVNEHASLKDGVALGHTTKIGGEVEGSIIEPYSNKQHYGFLGHSYVGSWVNLGAGTTNSDLKNTYGPIAATYGGKKVATGMQFLGAIIGDYAKTAINASIFTGKTIGACSTVYGTAATNAPSFTNYAKTFGQVSELPLDVAVKMQQRMFARRGLAQRDCDIRLLEAMFRLTKEERVGVDQKPLSFQ